MLPTNETRAARAERTLRDHFKLYSCGAKFEDETPSPLVDLLADLRHWADRNDVDFYRALDTSFEHYSGEVVEERREKTLAGLDAKKTGGAR